MNNIDIKISANPLSIDHCYSSVLDKACGGVCMFIGTVRNHFNGQEVKKLEFEAYEVMAKSEMFKIAEEAFQKFDVQHISIHHRSGVVGISEIAVIIAVSSHHRDASFKASRFIIDTLKETVPIWKKEFLADGSYWVNAHP